MRHAFPASLALDALLALSVTGCAVSRDQSTVGQYVDDTGITTRVKARFAEDKTVSAVAIRSRAGSGMTEARATSRKPAAPTTGITASASASAAAFVAAMHQRSSVTSSQTGAVL